MILIIALIIFVSMYFSAESNAKSSAKCSDKRIEIMRLEIHDLEDEKKKLEEKIKELS